MTVGFGIMEHKGMLIPGVNPLLQLAIMYPASQYGSTFPDNDHHWEAVGNKSPVNWVVHKILHLSKPKHRSWQTHSILFTGALLLMLFTLVSLGDRIWSDPTATDWILMRLLAYGFILGVVSHLVADFINPSGIHLYPGYKIRAVPRTSFFATGGVWESKIIYPACLVVSLIASINILLQLSDKKVLSLVMSITGFN